MSSSNLMDYFSCVYDEEQKIWKSGYQKKKYDENLSMGQVLYECLKQKPENKLQVSLKIII